MPTQQDTIEMLVDVGKSKDKYAWGWLYKHTYNDRSVISEIKLFEEFSLRVSPSTGCWRCSFPVQPRGSPIWPAGECCVCWVSSCSSSAGSWWLGHLPSVKTRTGSWLSSRWATRPTGCSSACASWIAGTTWWLLVSTTTALCFQRVLRIELTTPRSVCLLRWENVASLMGTWN